MNIKLRPLKLDDASELANIANNINICNMVRDDFPYPYTIKDAIGFISFALSKETNTEFAIEADQKLVGIIGYIPKENIHSISAEVGYWIGEEFWNRGIGSKALTLLCEYIFNKTEIIHLYAITFEHNLASSRVLEKTGFNFVGTLHKSAIKNKRVIDLLIYEKNK